jgi:hypothetical protein
VAFFIQPFFWPVETALASGEYSARRDTNDLIRSMGDSFGALWFETREVALLTMRVSVRARRDDSSIGF